MSRNYISHLFDRDPFSLFLLLFDRCKYWRLSLEFVRRMLGFFCIDSALKDNPTAPTKHKYKSILITKFKTS